jgi:hypothetical protein
VVVVVVVVVVTDSLPLPHSYLQWDIRITVCNKFPSYFVTSILA